MVQRHDLLPIAFGGLFLGLVMVMVVNVNIILFAALATCLMAVLSSRFSLHGSRHGDFMGKAKSSILSAQIFADQIPTQTQLDSENAIDLLENINYAQQCAQEDTPRETEKKRLLQSLKRERNTWSSNHPRHRLLDALFGFQSYYERQQAELDRFRGLYRHVDKKHRALLDHHIQYYTKFDRVDEHLLLNQLLCDKIVQNALAYYQIPPKELKKHAAEMVSSGKRAERAAVSQALKHYARDWTSEGGVSERKDTFAALLNTLRELYPHRNESNSHRNEHNAQTTMTPTPLRVLIPGSGLNRLAHDIARLGGFHVTANEWSAYMNVAYRFLETGSDPSAAASSFSLHPFVDAWSHHVTEGDMLRAVRIPDVPVDASDVLLVEGDFTTVFRAQAASYDVLVTYFFIDTARNLLAYLDTIAHLLRPGGHWLNCGPLLYGSAPLVQLALDEVLTVAENIGFTFLDTDPHHGPLTIPSRTVRSIRAVYSFDEKAMTTSAYKAQFWVARKT